MPEVHRRAIVDAHAAALVAARDGEGLCALVASLDGALAWGVVMAVGNARELAPFAPVAAHALERDEPDVRLAGVYVVRRWLAAGGEVGAMAAGLVRAAADERRGEAVKGKVSTAARDALREAAQRPGERLAVDAAVAAAEPASLRRALEKLVGDAPPPPRTVAEAVRALQRDPRLQVAGLAYLTSALVKDAIDVRAAFPFVSRLLAATTPPSAKPPPRSPTTAPTCRARRRRRSACGRRWRRAWKMRVRGFASMSRRRSGRWSGRARADPRRLGGTAPRLSCSSTPRVRRRAAQPVRPIPNSPGRLAAAS
ncbi:MAG: hypothetical protein IPH80_28245 [Myxococcales bacterium]|nr:hypothetical protein [Myxococcales bacterium]